MFCAIQCLFISFSLHLMQWGETRVIPMYCRFVGYKQVHERKREKEKKRMKRTAKLKNIQISRKMFVCVCVFLCLYLILFIHH